MRMNPASTPNSTEEFFDWVDRFVRASSSERQANMLGTNLVIDTDVGGMS